MLEQSRAVQGLQQEGLNGSQVQSVTLSQSLAAVLPLWLQAML